MHGDKLSIACYGDRKILGKLKYFFKEDLYELYDVKLGERINLLRVNLKYVFYNRPISDYFKNEESLIPERALICIYFLYLSNLDEYKNEKEYILNRYRDSTNDEHEECIIIYAYNLEDNVNEIKNIKKIKADFSHNSHKSIKILSVPILKNEDYNANPKTKELYEHFKIRYTDHLKICIEKKFYIIKNGYNKSMTNFLNYADFRKKALLEKKKKKKFYLTSNHIGSNHGGSNHGGSNHGGSNHIGSNHGESNHIGSNHIGSNHIGSNHRGSNHIGSNHIGSNHGESNQGGDESIEWQISKFVDFYREHNVFPLCNDVVDINNFLRKNDVASYISTIEFVTNYDEEFYQEMYNNYLSLFMWTENMCLLYFKLSLFKKSYILYSTIEKLYMKYLNVFIKKKKCILYTSIFFEKNYLTIARYIREKNICSLHLLEYIFFKKFTLLLFLNNFSYISIKALKFSQFFYKNKIFIFMHNFGKFKSNFTRNSKDPNYLKNIQKKISKYRRKDRMKRAILNVGKRRVSHDIHAKKLTDVVADTHRGSHHTYHRKKEVINELKGIFSHAYNGMPTAKGVLQKVRGIQSCIEQDVEMGDETDSDARDDLQDDMQDDVQDDMQDDVQDDVKDDVQDDVQDDVKDDVQDDVQDDVKDDLQNDLQDVVQNDPVEEPSEEQSEVDQTTQGGEKAQNKGESSAQPPQGSSEGLMFLLNCCFMNKECYFAIYFYNLGNLIKFLFERRSCLYQEEKRKREEQGKKQQGEKQQGEKQQGEKRQGEKRSTHISKYLSLQKNIMKLGYRKNFSKKKKSKKSLKMKTKRSNSLNDSSSVKDSSSECISTSSSSHVSSALSDASELKNKYKIFLNNDFCINISNILKLSFLILKNSINMKNSYFFSDQRKCRKYYLLDFYYNYLEEKRFNKNIQSVGVKNVGAQNVGVKNVGAQNVGVKNVGMQNVGAQKADEQRVQTSENKKGLLYYNFPIYYIKYFSKYNLKKYNYLLINISNKIIHIYSKNNNNTSIIHKLFLAILFYEHSIYKKSFKVLKKIIEKCTFDFLTILCMQLILFLNLNNYFYHFVCSFFLSNKYTKIVSFKNVNPYFTILRNDQYYLFCVNNPKSILKLEGQMKYDEDFFVILEKDILLSRESLNKEVASMLWKEEKREKKIPTKGGSKNKLIKSLIKRFCTDHYYFDINNFFLKNLKKFNFSISKNEQDNPLYIPQSGIKILVQSNYNLYIFVSSMIFGKYNEDERKNNRGEDHTMREEQFSAGENDCCEGGANDSSLLDLHHIETLLSRKVYAYMAKAGEQAVPMTSAAPAAPAAPAASAASATSATSATPAATREPRVRVRKLCVQYDENLDVFVFSALTKPLQIHGVIIQLYSEKEDKRLYLKFCEGTYTIRHGLNLIKLNIVNILESNKIKWDNFSFKVTYVFFIINEFCLYQKIGILPNRNLVTPFLSAYSNFINSNYILIDTKKFTSFFLYQLITPLYIKIKTLDTILKCKLVASFLNSTSLVYDNVNCVQLIVTNNHRSIDWKNHDQLITTNKGTELAKHVFLVVQRGSGTSRCVDATEGDAAKGDVPKCGDTPTYENPPHQSDSITFYVEANGDVEIEQPKVLGEEVLPLSKRSGNNNPSVVSLEAEGKSATMNYSEKEEECTDGRKEKSVNPSKNVQAIISFIPKRVVAKHETVCEGESTNRRNDTSIVRIICVLNVDFRGKKRKERKTDLYKLADVNYVGKIKFYDFINPKENSSDSCLNNQIKIEKTFNLVNIFNEHINTYRSNHTILYELILKLHNDNYSIFLKRFYIYILKKLTTQIKNVRIFYLNNEGENKNNEEEYFANNINSFDLSQCEVYHQNDNSLSQSDECNDLSSDVNSVNGAVTRYFTTTNGGGHRSWNPCSNANKKNSTIDERKLSDEEKHFYDEIDINSWIKGGSSFFLLFEVQYSKEDFNGDRNAMNSLNYESTIGNLNISYQYKKHPVLKSWARKERIYNYTIAVCIPQFLLPINVQYDIPKSGVIHYSMKIKIVISNNVNDDIYVKYFVCIDNEKKKKNNENEYYWLINGFKKRVLLISKNSEQVINLTVVPLKIGLINFPSICYFVKLNNKWTEITKLLTKSENFQVIISPSLQFSPQIWQLM
ncbi:conserved Plasmodium protein, unknown function [Plasmodium ovale]|uniref:Uncharacterized protein n=1 Tax=Plasmodium ovale TaxID=36330 RepID=A0A1C3KT35_PLAOA|nr:conserved Plasmodium protein, unknown function [Plasmodium ovale]